MKKLLSVCCIVLLVAAVPAMADGDKTKKSGCATKTADGKKSGCDATKAATKVADKAKSGCSTDKVTRVADDKSDCSKKKSAKTAELVTVSGTLVHCTESMGKVAEANGMCPTGTPASGKALLVKADGCGSQILVTAAEKIALADGITKIRATGKMEGNHLVASKLEVWSEENGWKEIAMAVAEAS